MERRGLPKLNFLKRGIFCLIFLWDATIMNYRYGYNLNRKYAAQMIDQLRIFKRRIARLQYEEEVRAPKSIIVRELYLVIQAIRRLTYYRFLFLLSLRWKNVLER